MGPLGPALNRLIGQRKQYSLAQGMALVFYDGVFIDDSFFAFAFAFAFAYAFAFAFAFGV